MFQTTNQWKKAWNAMKCCNFGENSDQLHLTSQFLSPPYINFDPEPLQWLEMNPANCGDLTNKIWRYQLIHMFAVLSSWICVKNPKKVGVVARKWPNSSNSVVPWTWNPEKSQPIPIGPPGAKQPSLRSHWLCGSLVGSGWWFYSEQIPSGHGKHCELEAMAHLVRWLTCGHDR